MFIQLRIQNHNKNNNKEDTRKYMYVLVFQRNKYIIIESLLNTNSVVNQAYLLYFSDHTHI